MRCTCSSSPPFGGRRSAGAGAACRRRDPAPRRRSRARRRSGVALRPDAARAHIPHGADPGAGDPRPPLPLRLAGAQAAHGRGRCSGRGREGLEDARPGGRGRLRRAHHGLAPERARPDRRRAVPELRPARARRDLLPPGDDRPRLDRACGSGDPDRTHPARRRAPDLRRPPAEPLHAARADVPDPRPRVDHEPLPEGALRSREGGAGRRRAALLAGPGRPGGGGLVRVGRLDPLPPHAAAVLACRAPAGGRPVVAELPRRRGHGDQDGERRPADGRAAVRAGLPADARPRVGARGDALLLPRADPAPTLALPPVGQDVPWRHAVVSGARELGLAGRRRPDPAGVRPIHAAGRVHRPRASGCSSTGSSGGGSTTAR